MHSCHIICGPPASGKSFYAEALADKLGAFILDSDEVAEKLVVAGLELAGHDPDDRDSPIYKAAYRIPVYETLFDLAVVNLERTPVVIAGPFTSEASNAAWPSELERRLGVSPELHFVWAAPETRRKRMEDRCAGRDESKLRNWKSYLKSCREEPPVWQHNFIDTTER